jgi:hypothetical protein
MKAISEVITTIIVYSTLVALALFMSVYIFYNATEGIASTEYYYVRQIFQSSASNIPVIVNPLSGGTYIVSYPGLRMGIGWKHYGDIELYINGSKTLNLPCMSIYSMIDKPIITHRRLLYGVDELFVNDTRLLPRAVEYYANGSTFIELDTCRLLASIMRVGKGGLVTYYVRLFYINITPIAKFQGFGRVHTLRFYHRTSPIVLNYDNVYGLLIRFKINNTTKDITPGDLGIAPPIYLSIIIYNIGVEMT